MRIISIYAFRKPDGRIAYLGQSINPFKRRYTHQHSKRFSTKLKDCSFEILETCVSSVSCAKEREAIKALWKKGQCWLNKRLPQRRNRYFYAGIPVLHNGKKYESIYALANAHRITVPGLDHQIKKGWIPAYQLV